MRKESFKVIFPSFLTLVLFAAVLFGIILPTFNTSLMDKKKEKIQDLTQTAWHIMDYYYEQEKSGKLSREQAQGLAAQVIGKLRYGADNKDYFWINDQKPAMIMHPYRPELNGTDLSDFHDQKGKHLFVSFVETVQKYGSGFVPYMWQWKDNENAIVPKLSFVKGYTPWDWIIGTGVYLEDAEQEISSITRNVIKFSLSILLVTLFISFYIIRQSLKHIQKKQGAEAELSQYRAQLEQLVEQRTTELALTNKQLQNEISERQLQENALRESEERYRSVFKAANDSIFTMKDHRCLDCNSKTLEMFGCSRDEFIGCIPYNFSPDTQPDGQNSQQKATELINRALSGIAQIFDWVHTRADGREFEAEVSLNRIVLSTDTIVQAIVRDVTQRKRMEQGLFKTQKLEAIGILAGGIAHDFNNLLTAIVGNISLVKMAYKPEDKEYQRLMQSEKASFRARDLTRQLLTFSKGGTPIKETTSILDLIKDSSNFIIRGTNVKCDYHLPENLNPVEADKSQLYQVIQNLIINACQAMPSGGTITIQAKNEVVTEKDNLPVKNGAFVKISLADEGKGIAPDNIEKIFDPYFTTREQGSGLGLSISYSIIKKHGGCLLVESELGVGSVFHIYLPASEKTAHQKIHQESEISLKGCGRILVMDDEELVRDFSVRMLEHLGYQVDSASEGQEALDLYQEAMAQGNPFDVVIMDLTIPGGMGGVDAIRKLIEIDPEVKAIVSSGYANDPVMSNHEEYGFCGVIPKPYDLTIFSRTLKQVLSLKKK
ncbi:MAG: cache domain-containing protein [Proteobacteria bacterium]|nr:cache domain-containing protein [Pseudomonadota bacterium]